MNRESNTGLFQIRQLFNLAHKEEDKCSSLINTSLNSEMPVIQAYRAAAMMISSKYIVNPFKKMNVFNQGKNILEDVVSENYGEPEIHFIRYTIQLNTPALLGYFRQIEADRAILREYLSGGPDAELKEHMAVFITDTGDELLDLIKD